MPQTPELSLPYPADSDPVDVPVDLRELAERIEQVLSAGDDLVFTQGDIKVNPLEIGDHGRWLLCDGRSLTQAEIEAALSLDAGEASAFVTAMGTGPTSKFGAAAAADEVRLPDVRGRAIVGAGQGAGLTDRAIGATFGAEAVTLTAAQSGVRDHSHEAGSLVAASHQHADGTLAVAAHSHADGSLQAAAHTHGDGTLALGDAGPGGGADGDISTGSRYYFDQMTGATASAGADVTGATGDAAPDVTGQTAPSGSVDVSGDVSAVTHSQHASNGQAAQASHQNVQPSIALGNVFIRV